MNTVERSIKPDPDPTLLTTENLRREILGLRELLEEKIGSVDSRLRTNRQRARTDHEAIRAVMDERFRRLEQHLALMEQQRVEQKKDTKEAVDAALTAQKEMVREQTTASERAIAKSETATNSQLAQLVENFRTEMGAIRTVVEDLKGRVGGIESTRTGGQQSFAQMLAIIGTIAFIVSAGVAVIIATR